VKQTFRDQIKGELSLEYVADRMSSGWKVESITWVREAEDANIVPGDDVLRGESAAVLPYGFQLTAEGFAENPLESAVLLLILDQIVREKRIQEIAQELNFRGYVTRESRPWTATDVFELMPRLIEAGPALLKSSAWQHLRPGKSASDLPQ
jgi:hypothetical protein